MHRCFSKVRSVEDRDEELEERSVDVSAPLEAKSIDADIEARAETIEDTAGEVYLKLCVFPSGRIFVNPTFCCIQTRRD